ncbi:MAG: M28 family peptidase [Cytophagaceae bacterium]
MKNVVCIVFILICQVVSAQDMTRVKRIVDTLCSPTFAGRGASGSGDVKASEFLVNEIKFRGGEPFQDTSYRYPFTYVINTFEGKVELKVQNRLLVPGVDYIVNSKSGGGSGKGKIVYADSLWFVEGNSSLKIGDLKKKVLVLNAKQFRAIRKEISVLNHCLSEASCWVVLTKGKLTMGLASEAMDIPVFELREDAWDFKTKKIEWTVENSLRIHNAYNVAAKIEGRKTTDSCIVFTAHYDHLGKMGDKVYFPGANDNASGVSMLLELLSYFKEHPLDIDVVFIFFAGEEAGLKGSMDWVQSQSATLSNIKCLVNLDLVGTGDDGIMVVNGKEYPAIVKLLEEINNREELLPAIKTRGSAANSDHYSFYIKGVKSVFIYTLGGVAAYHDVADISSTLPYTKYKELFTLLLKFAEKQTTE